MAILASVLLAGLFHWASRRRSLGKVEARTWAPSSTRLGLQALAMVGLSLLGCVITEALLGIIVGGIIGTVIGIARVWDTSIERADDNWLLIRTPWVGAALGTVLVGTLAWDLRAETLNLDLLPVQASIHILAAMAVFVGYLIANELGLRRRVNA